MRVLSGPAVAASFDERTEEIVLSLLDIEYAPGFFLRFVNDTQDITHNSNVYTHYNFSIRLPNESEEGRNQVNLVIENIDGLLMQTLAELDSPIPITLNVVLRSSPDVVEAGPFVFSLVSINWDSKQITGTLIFEDLLVEVFPGYNVTPVTHPAAF